MRHKTPPALPPEVVRQIWRQVHAEHEYTTIRDMLDAFCPIAMNHPHYASGKEIADALQIETNKVNAAVQRVYTLARNSRVPDKDRC